MTFQLRYISAVDTKRSTQLYSALILADFATNLAP